MKEVVYQIANKKTVKYAPNKYDRIIVGQGACVFPLNHPDRANVSNTTAVFTSNVLHINPDGSFETENTFYVPFNRSVDNWIEP